MLLNSHGLIINGWNGISPLQHIYLWLGFLSNEETTHVVWGNRCSNMRTELSFDSVPLTFGASVAVMKFFGTFSEIELPQPGCSCVTESPQRGSYICSQCQWWTTLPFHQWWQLFWVKLRYRSIQHILSCFIPIPGTPMALKFFPRQSTSLTSFLREYNLSLSYCTHPSLTRALGIFFSTPSYYVFAQQAGLYGDLYSVIVSEVSSADLWHETCC